MEISGMVDKRNIFLLFGCYCHNSKLILDEKFETTINDYHETFHKMIFGAIYNIAKKNSSSKIGAIEIENELSQFESTLNLWKVNDGWKYIEMAIMETEDKIHNIGLYHDNVRKFSILRNAVDKLKLNIDFLYNINDDKTIEQFNKMDSKTVLNLITEKFNNFKSLWKENFGDNYSFHAGDNIELRIQEHKNQNNAWGYPFQSGYLTTVFRGMRPKKFMVRSSISGGGKTRNSLAEACNISCDKIYDWNKKLWVSTGTKQPVLFISTELSQEELQDCLLAHISGIDEDRIAEWKDITEQEEEIINISGSIVKESLLFGEYMPDFTIDSIKEVIERYVITQNITHCFFDYINDSPSLYSYYIEKTGVKLQTHQILFLFSAALKQLANKYNIYLGSATQMSSNWKEEKDGNAIKGSKAIIEKADYGVLALPVTSADIKKLKPILENGFYNSPNMAYYIFKNRGGKWKAIIVFTKINLGTVREQDCFVTNNDYELISDIEKTLIDFQMDNVGDVGLFDGESISQANEYIEEFNKVKI